MKKLLLLGLLILGFNSSCFADYHYINVDNIYHNFSPGERQCFTEYKAISDLPKAVYIFWYFDINSPYTAIIDKYTDGKLTDEISKSGWYNKKDLPTEENIARIQDGKNHTSYTFCMTNISDDYIYLYIIACPTNQCNFQRGE